jgi:hypothetical protein
MDALEARFVEEHAHDVETIARAIADTAASRPILCDLSASSAGVLEHNVSAQVATEYKRAAIAGARRLADIVGPRMGGFSEAQSIAMVAGVTLIIGGVWASSQPSPGLAAAYDANPDLRMMQIPLSVGIRELVATLLVGLQHREPSAT